MALDLKTIIERFNECANEIGGDLRTSIGSHDCSPFVDVVEEEQFGDEDIYYDIVGIETTLRVGCLCPDGIRISIKRQPISN